MFRNFTLLSLLLLFSFSLFAQDLQLDAQKISKIRDLRKIPNIPQTNNIGGGHNNGVQSLKGVIGNSTSFDSSYASVPMAHNLYTSCVYYISAAEMAAAGFTNGMNINEVAWTYYLSPSATVTGTLKVYLQNTSDVTSTKTSTWSTNISPMTLVTTNTSFTMSTTTANPSTSVSNFLYTGGALYIAWDLAVPQICYHTAGLLSPQNGGYNGTRMWVGTTSPPAYLGRFSTLRPETYLGTPLLNDASVQQVYTLGKLPIPYATPHTIAAAVANNGDDILTNKVVTLNITGANTYTETQTIPTMNPGYYYDVTFSGWTPTVAGTNTVTVSVPSDNDNSNNSKSVTQLITYNTYTYSYGPFPPSSNGGVGFNTTSGDFVARFHTSSATTVNQVAVNFTAAGDSFKIGIWDATGTGGTPGSLVWQSSLQISTAGVYTLPVNPVVAVNGDFFVGVRQLSSVTNVGFAYQTEEPVRSSTFYFTTPADLGAWTDFALYDNPFRFMIEPRLTLANDVGTSTIDYPVGGTIYPLANYPFTPKATIANFGSNNQSSFNVTMSIYDSNNVSVYTSTKSISSLNSGATQQVTFDATAFTPTAQVYKVKCITSLGSDADHTNDTVSALFAYRYWALSLTAFLEGYCNAGGTAMNYTPSVTVELHNSTAPYALVDSKTGTLSTAGVGTFNFTSAVDGTPYYIAVKTWNTVETWSATAQSFTSTALSYDFTTLQTSAYLSNMKQAGTGTLWCIYSGDVNQDSYVNLGDYNAVNNDSYNQVTGVVVTDVTGDQFTNLADYNIVNNNSYNQVKAHTLLVNPSTSITKPMVKSIKNGSK